MSDNFETGVGIFAEVYGEESRKGVTAYINSGAFGANQAKWAMEWAFGSVWAREGLERKLRSCAVLGMCIGMGARDEIKMHTIMGTRNGLSRVELEEIFYSSVPYCGLPRANLVKAAMLEAFAEMDAKEKK